tara:strand:+ start:738 stop:1226 length:489 start_codon:yes stop_codon:yes gene_type:complete
MITINNNVSPEQARLDEEHAMMRQHIAREVNDVSPETQALLDEAETRRGYISGDDYADIAHDLREVSPDYEEVAARGAAVDYADTFAMLAYHGERAERDAEQAERARITCLVLDDVIEHQYKRWNADEMSLLETMLAEAMAEYDSSAKDELKHKRTMRALNR